MTQLQAFHGDEAVKQKYITRVRWHREMDHLTQGVGWESNGITRGCAVGCTLETYDHSRYPIELGLPEWLAHLEDRIFEGLPREDALLWPERFLAAIPVGADLEPVRHQLAIRRMDRLIEIQGAALESAEHGVRNVIERTVNALRVVRSCHEAELGGPTCDWLAAARSAESAARSARSAAWSAAWSAESAAESAWAAAESARSAWQQEADDLVELLTALQDD